MTTQAAREIPCALVRPPSRAILNRPLICMPVAVKHDREATRTDAYDRALHITHIDRTIIRSYFHQQAADPMMAQFAVELFPESRRQWAINSRLPRGFPAKALPDELEQKLSVLGTGYARVQAGSSVLLIESTSRVIIDVLRDIHTPV